MLLQLATSRGGHVEASETLLHSRVEVVLGQQAGQAQSQWRSQLAAGHLRVGQADKAALL